MTDPHPPNRDLRRRSPFRTDRRRDEREIETLRGPGGLKLTTLREPERTGLLARSFAALRAFACELGMGLATLLHGLPGVAGRLRGRGTRTALVLGVMAALLMASFGLAALPGLRRSTSATALMYVLSADGQSQKLHVVEKGTQITARFDDDIRTMSVAEESILEARIHNSREVFLRGLELGTTTLLLEFPGDRTEVFEIAVQRNFSMLRRSLQHIHPDINLEVAPDREAVMLSGTVDEICEYFAAERAAYAFLEVGASPTRTIERNYRPDGTLSRVTMATPNVAVLNSIKALEPMVDMEKRIEAAISELGVGEVRVRRSQRGLEGSDANDVLVLEGTVRNQTALLKVLSLASRLYLGDQRDRDELGGVDPTSSTQASTKLLDDIQIIGDESGALFRAAPGGLSGGGNQGGLGSLLSGGSGSGSSGRIPNLRNQLQSNIARASALSLGGGRILSFLEVEELPQVRVDIRLFEIRRRALLDYNSEFAAAWSENLPTLAQPSSLTQPLDGSTPPTFGATAAGDVQEVFGFLGGALRNEFQLSGNDWAIDTALSLLETEGIAKSLASPSLTVLSGEQAFFQVGGSIPFEQNVATDAGTAVLQGTGFVDFGVNLAVRPLVGEDGEVTVDVQPVVSAPDSGLTAEIRVSTGGNLTTSAFSTRALRTSARLADGQALVIGGLNERSRDDQSGHTPFLHRIPLLGALFKSFTYADQDRELVFVVTPVVLRDRIPDVGLWAHGGVDELVRPLLPHARDFLLEEDDQ